ncbi:hypothetical protein AR679_gp163 [Yellowstone lake phycodnavirus 1]|uniref:hypothetical protein n=1 Tax=Yellowstone lake phycodnavirus 1 TaxID=1586713 RepID=UPI0006EBA714|nr:hypothetical protein AR679_gp163 [Yellowstone lake phycodnavirus 1]BAT22189.1 hypothetical protein [Yellowstone lake phycodnavirus 1]
MSLTEVGISNIDREITPLLQNAATVVNQILNLPGCVNLGSTGPTNFNTATSNFFCEMVVNLRSSNGDQNLFYRASEAVAGTGDNWALRVESGTKRYQFYMQTVDTLVPSVRSVSQVTTGVWTHVAFSYVNPTMYIFVNGVLQSLYSPPVPPVFTPSSATFIGTSATVSTWIPTQANFKDIRMFKDGTLPTSGFTPASAPFGSTPPSYVSGSFEVFNLADQYLQNGVMN